MLAAEQRLVIDAITECRLVANLLDENRVTTLAQLERDPLAARR